MSEHVTKKDLEQKVEIINKKLNKSFYLDYGRYYGGYFLSETTENWGRRDTENVRMSAKEMNAYLKGIIWQFTTSEL